MLEDREEIDAADGEGDERHEESFLPGFHGGTTVVVTARGKLGAVTAIEEINEQADDQPDEEAIPGDDGQSGHEQEAEDDAERGNDGPPGTTKPRRRWGSRKRRTMTPMETRTKAKSVPMLERSASVPMSKRPEGMATTKPATQVEKAGVRKRGWTLEKTLGSRPSRDMENHTRDWPIWRRGWKRPCP